MKKFPEGTEVLYLLDISSFIFRAFFAIRSLSSAKTGEPTNAVYGVASTLAKLENDAKPKYVAVAYDSKETTFREEQYSEYKANRSEPPDDLIPQFARIDQLVEALEIPSVRKPGFEADDIIATLTKQWTDLGKNRAVIIVSSDKDLTQLVNDRVWMWDTFGDRMFTPVEVKEKFGVEPSQITDYLGLVGDASDNIPGVPGIGPKTAVGLIAEFGTVENILKAAKAGKITGKKCASLVENEASAVLSKDLSTVKYDVPFELDVSKIQYRFHVTPKLEKLFNELSFEKVLEKWKSQFITSAGGGDQTAPALTESDTARSSGFAAMNAAPVLPPAGDFKFITINTKPALEKLLKAIEKNGEVSIDLETTSLNPREAEIVGIAASVEDGVGYYIPIGHRGLGADSQLPAKEVIDLLRPMIENSKIKKIGQNLKYDWGVLIEQGLKPAGLGADTMIAGYLIDSEGRNNLATLAQRYLDYTTLNFEDVCGKGANQISFADVPIETATRYSAEDAAVAYRLWKKFQPQLVEEHLIQVFASIEVPLVPVLCDMELSGITLDVGYVKKLATEFQRDLLAIETKVRDIAGFPININSSRQVADLLFEKLKLPTQGKGKTGFSTDASVLKKLIPFHEVPKMLLEYREISKLLNTYIEPLPTLVDPKTKRIHTHFHQTIAATGRLSSVDPNLQNIPIRSARGNRLRGAFVAKDECTFISADYSQIELRLLAHMSGDPELVRAFQAGEDVHRKTASDIFSISLSEVSDNQRAIAKAINFGLMYGKSAFGLAEELNISRSDAKQFIEKYFSKYSKVKQYLDGTIREANDNGYVSTMLGRKRRLPDIRSKNAMMRSMAERMAMNSPLQGTAADLIKIAMINLDHELKKGGFEAKMILQVHDEILLEAPESEVREVSALTKKTMETALELSVPLVTNLSVGKNWMEL